MLDLTIVEYGDPARGGGFVLYEDGERPAPPTALQKAAEQLQTGLVMQPPEGVRDSVKYPAWSLHHLQVEQLGPHWCFAVQGRGGAFGRAGSCQYAFAPGRADPARVWAAGSQLVGPDGRLGDASNGHQPHGGGDRDRLDAALASILSGSRLIVVDGEPAEVAAMIGGLLGVLPVGEVRRYSWLTYLLRPPVEDRGPMVTGRWPAELRSTDAARRVERTLADRGHRHDGRHQLERNPKWPAAVSWLADRAAADDGIGEYRRLPDLVAVVDAVSRDQLELRVEDVSALAAQGSLRLSRGIGPALTKRWAKAHPDEAIRLLVENRTPGWLTGLALDGLLAANAGGQPHDNPVRFPPDPERIRGWHDRLAELLLGRYPQRSAMEDFVRDALLAPGRPLEAREAVEQATPWLKKLGLSPKDPSTRIFPVPTDQIAQELRSHQQISIIHRERLARAADPEGELRRVLDLMGHVPPKVGAALIRTATQIELDERQLERLTDQVLNHNHSHPDQAGTGCAGWLAATLAEDQPAGGWELLAGVGIDHLTRHGSRPLPKAFVAAALRHHAAELDDRDPLLHALLDDAAQHLSTPDRTADDVRAAEPEEPGPGPTAGPQPAPAKDATDAYQYPLDMPGLPSTALATATWVIVILLVIALLYVFIKYAVIRY